MNVLIKYLSLEAIENTITCMHFKIDKVLFFSREWIKKEERKNITNFLKNYCNVKDISFAIDIDSFDVKDLEKQIETKLMKENDYYFDLTGANGIFIAACMEVSKKRDIPIHLYDVYKDQEIILSTLNKSIEDVKKQKIKLNIERYIQMVGGCINTTIGNSARDQINEALLGLKKEFKTDWKEFCLLVQDCSNSESPLKIRSLDVDKVIRHKRRNIQASKFFAIMKRGEKLELFQNVWISGRNFVFEFCSDAIRQCVEVTGTLFEQETYLKEKVGSDDCLIGVHLDWDGIILKDDEKDLYNEVDVLRLDGNILTFISCKDVKKLDRFALYELETVARRFGGNYAKMKLATTGIVSDVIQQRAASIGILIEKVD